MASIPLPALSINTQQQDPLSQYGKVMALRQAMMQQGQEQQLQPLRLQQAQQSVQSGQLDLQMKQQQVNDGKIAKQAFLSAFGPSSPGGVPSASSGAQAASASGPSQESSGAAQPYSGPLARPSDADSGATQAQPTPDAKPTPELSFTDKWNKVLQSAAAGGMSQPGLMELSSKALAMQDTFSKMNEEQRKTAAAQLEASADLVARAQSAGVPQPGEDPRQAIFRQQKTVEGIRQSLFNNPDAASAYGPNFVKMMENYQYRGPQSIDATFGVMQAQKDMLDEQSKALANKKAAQEVNPLPVDRVDQINQLNASLLRTIAPKSVPQAMLPANATEADVARVDALVKNLVAASGSQATRQLAQATFSQTSQIRQEAANERKEKEGMTWAQWTDQQTGRVVAGPITMARAAGAQDMATIPTNQVANLQDARGVVNLITKKGDTAASMGINQLIDSLDKDGKLGIASSRLNSFLSGKVGAEPGDDPRVMALLDKADLAMTLSMKAHFGASGGRSPAMLEHFLTLANARKMNANTLKAGFAAVDDYMQDKGMMPAGARAGTYQSPPTNPQQQNQPGEFDWNAHPVVNH